MPHHMINRHLTDQQISDALALAEGESRRRCGPHGVDDLGYDQAVDAVMRCAAKYDPSRGAWMALAWVAISRAMATTITTKVGGVVRTQGWYPVPEPHVFDVSDELDEAGVERLPEALRKVIYFRCYCGFTLDETGLLCGITREAAVKRLRAAVRTLRLHTSNKKVMPR